MTTENQTTQLAIFSEADKNLTTLEEMLSNAVVNLETKQGLQDCQEAAKKMQKLRTGVEKARTEENKEAREHIKNVNDQAKAIQERIAPLEDKFKKPLDDRKEKFTNELAIIDGLPEACINQSSSFIGEKMEWLESIDPETKAEFKKDFKASLFTANDKLVDMFTAAAQAESEKKLAEQHRQEKEEAARKAEEEKNQLRKAAEIQQRLTKLQQIPLELMGKPSKDIKTKIEQLKGYEPTEVDFQDRLTETLAAKEQVITQLEMMHQMQLNTEQVLETSSKQAEKEKAGPDLNAIVNAWKDAHKAAKESDNLKDVDYAFDFLSSEHQNLEYWSSNNYFAGNEDIYTLITSLSEEIYERLEALKAQQHEELPFIADDNSCDGCEGCPDCQGINCAITEQAAKEELTDTPEDPEHIAANAICTEMLGQIDYMQALELVGYIKENKIHNVLFQA